MKEIRNNSSKKAALKVVFYYIAFAGMWILVSDRILELLVGESDAITKLQTYKGWLYVLLTGALLFWKLYQEFDLRQQAEEQLRKHRDSLEEQVQARTRQLATANSKLKDEAEKQHVTEKKLRESKERYRQLVEMSPDAIIVHSNERVVFVNKSTVQFLRVSSAEQLIGHSIFELISPQYRTVYEERVRAVLQGSAVPVIEYRIKRGDGNFIDVEVKSIPFVYQNQPAVQSVVRDITERKQLEQEVLRASKLESIGFLAGGIAHDFNNMLTIIIGNLSLAKNKMDDQNQIKNRLLEMEKAAVQAKELTGRLLAFAKGDAPIKKLVDLKLLVQDAVSLATSGCEANCHVNIPEDLLPAQVDSGQITQAINNLVINALQAMPDGGSIFVSAENVTVWQQITSGQAGRYVKITIRDQGRGIKPKNLQRIFDPYFTTKNDGSGLGLAVTYSIIKKHGGYISVDSKAGKGTAFDLYLPALTHKQVGDGISQRTT